ncbi:hypothetical protein GRS96_20370 (plasmid) [Rathayibacter sp. VKM Ac-2803]|nr:hypothetical protein [Rathayibacter sp. VKM Ac-2803]
MDPTRCETYMTSSQALTLNLFGPLLAEPFWFSGLLIRLLGRGGWDGSERSFIEYAPADRARRTGDRTIADVYVERTSDDAVQSLVIETKLADRFSSRFVDIAQTPHYQALNAQLGLWKEELPRDDGRATNQLARVHALGSTYSGAAATLVVLHHPLDLNTPLVAERYRRTLRDPSLLVVGDLASFIGHMASASSTPDQLEVVRKMSVRYVEMELSAPAWRALTAS